MANLLVNPNFDQPPPKGHEGWTRINNLWPISPKPSNPSPGHTAAQWDGKDASGTGSWWPLNSEDWLSQTAQAPEPHTQVTFSITEIRHPTYHGTVWISLEGSYDGLEWIEVWRRDGLVPGQEASNRFDWYTNAYQVMSDHTLYRLTIYGHYINNQDGWKLTLLSLEAS
jgi:hypothetical protein